MFGPIEPGDFVQAPIVAGDNPKPAQTKMEESAQDGMYRLAEKDRAKQVQRIKDKAFAKATVQQMQSFSAYRTAKGKYAWVPSASSRTWDYATIETMAQGRYVNWGKNGSGSAQPVYGI